MSILKVARMGHPVLRERARPLEPAELKHPLLQKLIDDMIETMHEYHGVGPGGAAGARGHPDLRRRCWRRIPGRSPRPRAIINPEIVPVGTTTAEGWEGCLSIPDIRGMVPRCTDITVRALDRKGKSHRAPAQGLRRSRRPARDRSSGRRAVLRPHDVDAVADLSRRVLALPRQGRGLVLAVRGAPESRCARPRWCRSTARLPPPGPAIRRG